MALVYSRTVTAPSGHSYTVEVRPAFRQYWDAARLHGHFDWSVHFENEYRPRTDYGTSKGLDRAIRRAEESLKDTIVAVETTIANRQR